MARKSIKNGPSLIIKHISKRQWWIRQIWFINDSLTQRNGKNVANNGITCMIVSWRIAITIQLNTNQDGRSNTNPIETILHLVSFRFCWSSIGIGAKIFSIHYRVIVGHSITIEGQTAVVQLLSTICRCFRLSRFQHRPQLQFQTRHVISPTNQPISNHGHSWWYFQVYAIHRIRTCIVFYAKTRLIRLWPCLWRRMWSLFQSDQILPTRVHLLQFSTKVTSWVHRSKNGIRSKSGQYVLYYWVELNVIWQHWVLQSHCTHRWSTGW